MLQEGYLGYDIITYRWSLATSKAGLERTKQATGANAEEPCKSENSSHLLRLC
jgi:hypothetical protein